MKPFDPRLLKYARAARVYIAFIAASGALSAMLVVAQAITIALAIAPVISEGATLAEVRTPLLALVVVVALRFVVGYVEKAWAHRAAQAAIRELRSKVLAHAVALGPRWSAVNGGSTATLLTRGLEDLGPYFISYVPQLVLSLTVTPLTLLVMVYFDWISALFAVVTIPLIPIFMILVGRLTQDYSEQKLATMEALGAQLLDLLAGLPTLKALGREDTPTSHVRKLGRLHAKTTMQTLRVAFLSGAVLEFLATLSVALVAVEVGLRLVSDYIALMPGLATIMLAPEVYKPLREVGKHFHASADGVAAANAAFDILELEAPEPGTLPAPDLRQTRVRLQDVSVAARGAWSPASLTATIEPGSICALHGESGAGKTTTVLTLLGLLRPTRGQIIVEPASAAPGTSAGPSTTAAPSTAAPLPLTQIDPASWWDQITWVPQTPVITAGTVLENITGAAFDPDQQQEVSDQELQRAARIAGFDSVVVDLPDGWRTRIGRGGVGLSVGQRQRLALTKALLHPTAWVVLDEPTAHLDAVTEDQVIAVIDELHAAGSTVILIAHRAVPLARADHAIEVTQQPASADDLQRYPELATLTRQELELTATPRLLEGDL